MDTNTPPVTPVVESGEDKTAAILAYLTLIGFIVAIILHGSKKTRLGAYHLRQSLGLMLTGIAVGMAAALLAFIPFVNFILVLMPLVWLGFIVLWVMGLIAAANGQIKPIPLLGQYYEKWFGRAFE